MIEGFDASRDSVRKTGRAFLLAGSVVAVFLFLSHSHVSGLREWNWRLGFETHGWKWFAGSGIVLFGASYLLYPVMKPIHIGWMTFAHAWGWTMTRIVLSLFFFVVLTPVGWVMRLLGKDLLDEKINREAASYWKKRVKPLNPRDMDRQF